MQHAKAEPDHWKKKYFDVLRSLEQEERDFRALEALLRRMVNRLCFAAQGRSEPLDGELRRLTDAMRRKAGEAELEALFAPLSEAITALDDAEPVAAARAAPRSLELGTAAESAPAAPAGSTASTPAVAPAEAVLAADERVRTLLGRVLAEMRRDARLSSQLVPIEAQLAQPLTGAQLPPVLGGIADLVAERISAIEQEKAEVERLLNQIGMRLDELTSYVAGEEQDRLRSMENTQTLSQRLTLEMKELGGDVDETGIDIVQLKLKVRTRLDSIGSHLQEFHQREQDRVRSQWERSEQMRERLERLESESRELQERLRDEQRLSLIDPLTQIPNRMAYDQRLEDEYARWRRTGQPLCLAAWDVDHFKRINDAYGHRAGDKVLRIVAETLAERLRKTDFLGRYGGEEFVMILPETDASGGLVVANKMREAVAALGFHFRGQPVTVTISCGLALLTGDEGADEAFERADKALYRAKEAGRNRCLLA